MAGVNHLHSDEPHSRSLISAVAAAGSSLPKEPPAWSIGAKALLHGVRRRYASPTFVAAHSHLLSPRSSSPGQRAVPTNGWKAVDELELIMRRWRATLDHSKKSEVTLGKR